MDDRVIQAVKSLIDFIYLASLHSHSRTSIRKLREALDAFHAVKGVFIELGARSPEHFNIPKVHAMEHYADLIEFFGSADGYNTESPERLHIDYAKEAYRASNKRDYTIQMVNWLHRQEAVDHFDIYLKWICQQRSSSTQNSIDSLTAQLSDSGLHGAEDVDDIEPDESVVLTPAAAFSHVPAHCASTSLVAASAPASISHVARRPPPHLRSITAEKIIEGHGASEFLPATQQFLRSHGSNLTPRLFDPFDLFKQIIIQLPLIPEVSKNHRRDVVRAFPPVAQSGRHQARSAQLDFALIRRTESRANAFTSASTGLHGELYH